MALFTGKKHHFVINRLRAALFATHALLVIQKSTARFGEQFRIHHERNAETRHPAHR